MKKINMVISFLLILILTSCNQFQNSDSLFSQNSETTLDAEINAKNNDKKENNPPLETSKNDLVPPLTSRNESNTDQGGHDVPWALGFSSPSALQEFVIAATGTPEQFEEFQNRIDGPWQDAFKMIRYEAAKEVAQNISEILFPQARSKITDFGASYYIDRKTFDVNYKINGIRYSYVYRFGAFEIPKYEAAATIKGLQFASQTLNLYEGDNCFVGYVSMENCVLQVVIDSVNTADATFDDFSFAKIDTTVKKTEQ